jgi:hypothetical protein
VLAAIRGVSTGLQPGIEGRNTGGGGPGISGTGDGAGSGVVGTGGATGEGGTFTGGATSGAGVSGTAIGAFFGVAGVSSATSSGAGGVSGTATRNDSTGVSGLALVAGANPLSESASAVLGLGVDASGVYGKSTNGYGVWAESDSTSPARAALHIEPQDASPTTVIEGDVWFDSAEEQLKIRQDGTTMGLWSTGHGYLYLFGENVAQVDNTSTTYTDVLTASFAAKQQPREAFCIATVTVNFEFGASSAGQSFEWKLIDDTASPKVDVFATSIEEVYVAGADAEDRYLTMKTQYTIPLAGARAFKLQIASVDGFITSRIRKASIEITGSHG